MRMRWPAWPGHTEEETRPQVKRAVEEARLAQAGIPRGLGSATVLPGVQWHLEGMQRPTVAAPRLLREQSAPRRKRRTLTQQLLWTTARAAQQLGRQPEEVWAEALHNWLAGQEALEVPAPRPRGLETRRQLVWHDIEATMAALRAS